MAYFTAVLTRDDGVWRPLDVDLEDASDVDDLAEDLRASASGGPVLVVLEREDEWFALLRADGPEPRAFVSDLPEAQTSRYAQLLSSTVVAPAPRPEPAADEDGERATAVAAPTWAGDVELLDDLGVSGEELAATAESADPAGALTQVGERCGFADLLEALR